MRPQMLGGRAACGSRSHLQPVRSDQLEHGCCLRDVSGGALLVFILIMMSLFACGCEISRDDRRRAALRCVPPQAVGEPPRADGILRRYRRLPRPALRLSVSAAPLHDRGVQHEPLSDADAVAASHRSGSPLPGTRPGCGMRSAEAPHRLYDRGVDHLPRRRCCSLASGRRRAACSMCSSRRS